MRRPESADPVARPPGLNTWHIKQAARRVAAGGLIAYPTEAVFGLGCDPLDAQAVWRLLALKRRSPTKGLIVIAADPGQLRGLVRLDGPGLPERLAETWPGPVTWILPARPAVPPWLRGVHSGLAVRVTAHPIARALCARAGPLVSTSANPAGRPPARSAMKVRAYFGAELDYIVPGEVDRRAQPTEIRDGGSGRVLRPGR